MKRKVMAAASAALIWAPASLWAQAAKASDPRDTNLTAYVELLLSDIRSQKIAVLTELLDLTEAQRRLRVPCTRLHDCHHPNPAVVDLHAIFPNPEADPALPVTRRTTPQMTRRHRAW